MKYHHLLPGKFASILNNNNNTIQTINYKCEKIVNQFCVNFKNHNAYKLLCRCNKLFIEKTKSFEIRYNECVSE